MQKALKLWRHRSQFLNLAASITRERGFFLIPQGSPLEPEDVERLLRATMPRVRADYGIKDGACFVTLDA